MKRAILLWCTGMVFMQSCLEEFPYESTLKSESFVVNGGVNNLHEDQFIHLSQTIAYGVPPNPITGADVSVIENDKKVYQFKEGILGEYVLNKDDYEPKIGASYALRISLQDQTYMSDAEIMMPPVAPDSLSWNVGSETVLSSTGIPRVVDKVYLQVHTPLPKGDKNLYLKWDVQTAFQFTTEPGCGPFKTTYTCYFGKGLHPSELMIYSNADNGLHYLTKKQIGSELIDPDYRFVETHYYSVYQRRISSNAYEYYQKLRLVSEQNGTIFDPIPATVLGNVHNKNDLNAPVLGYFLVSSVSILRQKIVSADFFGKYPLLSKTYNYCGWINGGTAGPYFSACCSCYDIPEPVIQKPDWW
jgi:hypothetical protein